MASILVAGLINIETTLKVDGFPLDYTPVRYPFFGVRCTVSGVGYNVAKALTTLGDSVNFLSLIGQDAAATLIRNELSQLAIADANVLSQLDETPQSVILYEPSGRRAINVDLKDIQQQEYPRERFTAALEGCKLAVLCNINFTRPMLTTAQRMGVTIATDVHAISTLDSDYDGDYMRYADLLFMSHEHLPTSPEDWVRQLWNRYGNRVIVIGLGAEGALLAVRADNFIERIPTVRTREIINTIGAGDALFSAFVHSYHQTDDPYTAIKKAVVFASYKIGERGAAEGFLDAAALDTLARQIYGDNFASDNV